MGKKVLCCLTVLLCAGASRSQEAIKVPAIQEIWEAAYLDGGRSGYFRTSFENLDVAGKKIVRSRQLLDLTVKRQGIVIRLGMQTGTDESPQGAVVGVFMQMDRSDIGPLIITGAVKEKILHLDIDKGRVVREDPWNDKVIGLQGQENYFHNKKFKPGDSFTYQTYEPSLTSLVTIRALVHEEEEVELAGAKKKLFRVVLAPDKIETPKASVQLPPLTVWMDSQGHILRRTVEMPGLGKFVLVRTTKAKALAPLNSAQFVDVAFKNMLLVDKRIFRHNATASAVYRITIDDPKPETVLAEDARQQIEKLDDKTIELRVKAIKSPPRTGDDKIGKEFLDSNYYLNSNDARIQALAKEAIGDESDPWFKARRIEGLVHAKMKIEGATPFTPAGQIAKDMRGDCRQCAMLTAAMCRAAGVPSRTAIGLVYAEDRQEKRFFATHMWTEVFVRGEWVGIDATLGEGSVGATHIKVTDHNWHNVQSLTPLLPLQRALGKMKIEIVRFDYK